MYKHKCWLKAHPYTKISESYIKLYTAKTYSGEYCFLFRRENGFNSAVCFINQCQKLERKKYVLPLLGQNASLLFVAITLLKV